MCNYALGNAIHSLKYSAVVGKSCDLRQKQEALGLSKHKLIAGVSTRWGSTFEMVLCIIEQQQVICTVLADDRKGWSKMPSEDEFTTLEVMVKVLEPLP